MPPRKGKTNIRTSKRIDVVKPVDDIAAVPLLSLPESEGGAVASSEVMKVTLYLGLTPNDIASGYRASGSGKYDIACRADEAVRACDPYGSAGWLKSAAKVWCVLRGVDDEGDLVVDAYKVRKYNKDPLGVLGDYGASVYRMAAKAFTRGSANTPENRAKADTLLYNLTYMLVNAQSASAAAEVLNSAEDNVRLAFVNVGRQLKIGKTSKALYEYARQISK